MQWEIIEDRGKPPPRAWYRTICEFMHEGKHYIASYGGSDKVNFINSLYLKGLYRYDSETFIWLEPPISGDPLNTQTADKEQHGISVYMGWL